MIAVGQFIGAGGLNALAVDVDAIRAMFIKNEDALALAFELRVVARREIILFETEIAGTSAPNVDLLSSQGEFIDMLVVGRGNEQAGRSLVEICRR